MVRWDIRIVGSNTHEMRIRLGPWYDNAVAVVRLDTGSLAYPRSPPGVHVREGKHEWSPYGDFLGRARVGASHFQVDNWKHFKKTFATRYSHGERFTAKNFMYYVYSALAHEVHTEMKRKRRVSNQRLCRQSLPLPADVLGEICSYV